MIAEPPPKKTTRRAIPSSIDKGHGHEIRRDQAGDRESTPSSQSRLDTDSDVSRARLEKIPFNTDQEDAYWDANHDAQAYAENGDYAVFAPAYRTGYEGYERFGDDYSFDDVEDELEEAYELEGSDLPWEEAREAARAAWERLANRENGEIDPGAPVP
jgi:hypothetical protein